MKCDELYILYNQYFNGLTVLSAQMGQWLPAPKIKSYFRAASHGLINGT